jgi:hypothetical protein
VTLAARQAEAMQFRLTLRWMPHRSDLPQARAGRSLWFALNPLQRTGNVPS